MNPRQLRARLCLGLALGLVLLLLALPLGYIVDKKLWADGIIDDIEPRYARLLGLQEMAERIERARAQAEAVLQEQVYPASLDTDRAGADLQQRLRAVAQQAGLSIQGSQITTVPPASARDGTPAEPFERIAVTINLEADLPALQEMLSALQQQRPAIHVESLSLRPVRGGRRGRNTADAEGEDGQRLAVQARLNAFRVTQ